MALDPPNLPRALLQWVQTFPTTPRPTSLSQLRDGHIIQQILHDIDPSYFPSDGLPADNNSETSSNWVQRWQNLKHIQRIVDEYSRDVCEVLAGPQGADLEAIARGGEEEGEMVKLLKDILRAGMYSPESNQRMGRVVVGLGKEVAGTIAAAMAGMDQGGFEEEEQQQEVEKGKTPVKSGTKGERDLELEHEEELISANRIIRQLEESNAKAALELEELRAEKVRIENALEALKQDAQDGGSRKVEDSHLRELRDRSDKDRDYIAEIESELETARTTAESQARQLERLKGSADSVQKLKDDLQLLKAERDELASKTRTNENLRKKIQNLQDAERQGAQLREDLRTAQEQLSGLDSLRDRCEALQKANAENMNIIASSEQEIFDMRSGRKRLEHELRVLTQKYEIARERQNRDHETITELETRLAQLETGDEEEVEKSGLGEEMDKADRPKAPSRKASVVAPAAGAQGDSLLEGRLAALARRNKLLEEQYLELLSDKLGLETAIAELKDGSSGSIEENVPFLEQRSKLHAVTDDLEKTKNETHQLTAQLAAVKEQLLAMQSGTLSEGEALDAIKEHAALSAAYAALMADADKSQADLDEHRALLRFALLSARGIGLEDEEERRSSERALAMKLLTEAKGADEQGVGDVADRVVARVEAVRSAAAQSAPRPEPNDEELASLRTELESSRAEIARLEKAAAEAAASAAAAASASAAAATKEVPVVDQKAAEEQARLMAQLRRENTLMSTAWFDLSARLQRENVILGRRRESPKSWLGKQRVAVGLGVMGAGGR